MRKIVVFTGTRAEYGLLYWLMKAIQQSSDLELQILVSGMHLAPQFGETWKEIEADGFKIDETVEMLLASDSPIGVVKSMGLATIGFADALARLSPDLLFVLGDRFETLALAQAALIMKIPIAHAHGGELTLGAYDDAIRHAVTKMASLHFVAAEEYRHRVIQMGEETSRVFNVGALGLEHVVRTENFSLGELAEALQIPLHKYFLVTYHPVTVADEPVEVTFAALLQVLDDWPEYQVLFTYPNADNGGHIIIQMLEDYCQIHSKRAFAVKSLGFKKYLSAVAHAEAVIGNSSSGIIEVPAFGLPTVNIGLRQEGRLAADSILHSHTDYVAIKEALNKALSPSFKEKCRQVDNPYGNGQVSARILPVLKYHALSTMKRFQNWSFHHD
jgi:UDP-hydrolysing UDP-N-acetyl-D-glucosamine 2-epimerase